MQQDKYSHFDDKILQDFIQFLVDVLLLSAVVIMSPGPITTIGILHGIKGGWRAGLHVAHGRALATFAVVIALGFGLLAIIDLIPEIRYFISFSGAMVIFYFCYTQMRFVIKQKQKNIQITNEYADGIKFTLTNPFTMIWWITVGGDLLTKSLDITQLFLVSEMYYLVAGILLLFFLHIWIGYVWLIVIGYFSSKASRFLYGVKFRIFILSMVVFLVYFGVKLLYELFSKIL